MAAARATEQPSMGEYCKANLRAYQKMPAKWMVDHPQQKGLYIYMDTGSGKTRAAANIVAGFMQTGLAQKIVVLTPAKLIENFRKGVEECTGLKRLTHHEIRITSFESLHKLRGFEIDHKTLVLIDEAHNLRKPGTKKYKLALNVADRCGHIVLMSATPMMTKNTDLFAQINLIVPEDERVATSSDNINPEDLFNLLRHKVAFFTLTGSDYDTRPAVKVFKVLVPMDPVQEERISKAMREMQIGSAEELHDILNRVDTMQDVPAEDEKAVTKKKKKKKKKASLSNAFMNKVRRFANAGSTHDCSPKIEEAVKLIQTSPGPTMLFSFWISMGVKLVKHCLKEAHYPERDVVTVTGSTSNSQLKKIMKAFNEDQTVKTLLFSSAASEGLSTKNVERFIMLEPQWQRLAELQAIARAVRINSHLTHDQPEVHVYYLMSHADGHDLVNVDEYMFQYNRDKYAKMLVNIDVMRQASIPMSMEAVVDISFSPEELKKAVDAGLVEDIETLRISDSYATTFDSPIKRGLKEGGMAMDLGQKKKKKPEKKKKRRMGLYQSDTARVSPENEPLTGRSGWSCTIL